MGKVHDDVWRYGVWRKERAGCHFLMAGSFFVMKVTGGNGKGCFKFSGACTHLKKGD